MCNQFEIEVHFCILIFKETAKACDQLNISQRLRVCVCVCVSCTRGCFVLAHLTSLYKQSWERMPLVLPLCQRCGRVIMWSFFSWRAVPPGCHLSRSLCWYCNGERLQTNWCRSDLIRWRRFTAFRRGCVRHSSLCSENTVHVTRRYKSWGSFLPAQRPALLLTEEQRH